MLSLPVLFCPFFSPGAFRDLVCSNVRSYSSQKGHGLSARPCVRACVCLSVCLKAVVVLCVLRVSLCGSCVLGLADVVGGHVAALALRLAQPPLAVAVHVLELQDAHALVGRDAELVGAARAEGVEGVVDLHEREREEILTI